MIQEHLVLEQTLYSRSVFKADHVQTLVSRSIQVQGNRESPSSAAIESDDGSAASREDKKIKNSRR